MINIKYIFGVLCQQPDLFADFIMFLCDNEGRTLTMDRYPDYISRIRDINDIEERISLPEE